MRINKFFQWSLKLVLRNFLEKPFVLINHILRKKVPKIPLYKTIVDLENLDKKSTIIPTNPIEIAEINIATKALRLPILALLLLS